MLELAACLRPDERTKRWFAGAAIAAALATPGGAWPQTNAPVKVKPAETWWGAYYGLFTGFAASGELMAAINEAQQANFTRCLAQNAAKESYNCGKLVITSIRQPQATPNYTPTRANGEYIAFPANAYTYYQQKFFGFPPTTGTIPANDIVQFNRELRCPSSEGFGVASTTVGPSNFLVECVKYEPAARQCPSADDAGRGCGEALSAQHQCVAVPGEAGNPIRLVTARKTERHVDYRSAAGLLDFVRVFRGQMAGWRFPGDSELVDLYGVSQSNHKLTELFEGRRIDPTTGNATTWSRLLEFPFVRSSNSAEVHRINPDGTVTSHRSEASGQFTVTAEGDWPQRVAPPTSDGAVWRWRRSDDVTDEYGEDGKRRRRYWPDGRWAVFTYAGDVLATISDRWGRELRVNPDASGRVSQVILPDGMPLTYTYTGAMVSRVTYPDGTSRNFVYGEPANTANNIVRAAMTGVIDENGKRIATYKFDASGRAISTEGANGVNRYAFEHFPSYTRVTTPLNSQFTTYVSTIANTAAVTSRSQPAGSGCAAAVRNIGYDSGGNVASATDFTSRTVCYVNDATRRLQTVRVEGLSSPSCSSVTPVNASLPAGARKISTQWHPDWRMPTRIAEPRRITTRVYHGQPDPFVGNAIASCAPANALLPDGRPIAVVCKQVEQATTDGNGSQGFGAGVEVGAVPREQRWTYNRWGQVLTHDGPRTDVSDVTTYTYHEDTLFSGADPYATGHTIGDLRSVTNAAGLTTQFTKYDKHGQLVESVDANGVVTAFTYDLRQRLLSVSIGGQATVLTYDPAGLLRRLTFPDASWIAYEYDDAHRQIAALDNRGNRVDYQLDNAGNRTAESFKDPSGSLRRTLSRSIDALGRVQQVVGRE